MSEKVSPTEEFNQLDAGRARFRYENQEAMLEKYVQLTDSLIRRIENFETDSEGTHPADVVIFLDKSARPVYWFTKELWPHLATPDKKGDIPNMPLVKFLNIDRLPWRLDQSISIVENPSNMRKPSKKAVEGLRSIFVDKKDRNDEDIMHSPSELDGKRILIVDEVRDTGDTAQVALNLLSEAFPDARFKNHAWMDQFKMAPDGTKQVLDVPVWYHEKDVRGRDVGGQLREGTPGANTSSRFTKESHQFLSTRLRMPPRLGQDEREQLAQLLKEQEATGSDEDKRRLSSKIEQLTKPRMDEKSQQLRREIGRVANMFASTELITPTESQNMMPQEKYDELLRERIWHKNRNRSLLE